MRPTLTIMLSAAAAGSALLLTGCGGTNQTTAGGAPAQPMSPASGSGSTGSATSTAQEQQHQSGPPKCVAADMKGVFGPGDSVYSGTLQLSIIATNTSDHTCTVFGYGGLSMHTGEGVDLHVKLTREPKPAQASITLKPGGKAYKKLLWAVPIDDSDATCAQGAAYANVTMPDDTKTFEVHPESGDDTLDICGDLKGYAWTATDLAGQG